MLGDVTELLKTVGHRMRLHLLGVVIPGALLLVESTYAFSNGSITDFLDESLAFEGAVATDLLLVALAVFAAYLLGYFAREAMFLFSDLLLRTIGSYSPKAVLDRMDDLHSADAVAKLMGEHHLLVSISGRERHEALGGRRTYAFYLQSYARLWLRTHRPELSVDHLEVEMNFSFGVVLPVLLSPLLSESPHPWMWIGSGLGAVAVFILAHLERNRELEDAVRYFLYANAWEPSPKDVGGPPFS